LAPFYGAAQALDKAELNRDLGIALMHWDTKAVSPAEIGSTALLHLQSAVERRPEDLDAGDALGRAFSLAGRREEALVAFQRVLAQAPRREATLANAGTAAALTKRSDEAIDYLSRALAINPWVWQYHFRLAKLHAWRQEWMKAKAECEEALKLNPADVETRRLILECCVRTGESARARAEAEVLKSLNGQH
jgi:tetratricopeptide (TPR) repeat protein